MASQCPQEDFAVLDQHASECFNKKEQVSIAQQQHLCLSEIPTRVDSVLPSTKGTKDEQPWKVYSPHSAQMRKTKLDMLGKRYGAPTTRRATSSMRSIQRPSRKTVSTRESHHRKQPSRLQRQASYASIDLGIPNLPCTDWENMDPIQRRRYYDQLSMYSGSSIPMRPISRPRASLSPLSVRNAAPMDESRQASASRLQALGTEHVVAWRSSSRSSVHIQPKVEKDKPIFSARICMDRFFCRRGASATRNNAPPSASSASRLPVRVGTTLPARLKSRRRGFGNWYRKTVPQSLGHKGVQAEALARVEGTPVTAIQPEYSSVPSPNSSIRRHISVSTPILRPSTSHGQPLFSPINRRAPHSSRSMPQLRSLGTILHRIPENMSFIVTPSQSRRGPRRSASTDSTRSLEDRLRNTRLEDLASISPSDVQEISKLVRDLDGERQDALGRSARGERSVVTVPSDTPRHSLENGQADESTRLLAGNRVLFKGESGPSNTSNGVPDEL
jgi:hypothetical protein